MREVNVPEAAYGVIRTQPSESVPLPTVKSLASGRMFAVIATECVATTAPSIENVTFADDQSMRKRCCAPSQFAPSAVSVAADPLLVRAKTAPPPDVLNIAQGAAS